MDNLNFMQVIVIVVMGYFANCIVALFHSGYDDHGVRCNFRWRRLPKWRRQCLFVSFFIPFAMFCIEIITSMDVPDITRMFNSLWKK